MSRKRHTKKQGSAYRDYLLAVIAEAEACKDQKKLKMLLKLIGEKRAIEYLQKFPTSERS